MSLGTGTRLGPYEILAPLGAGGMGEVYKARDTRLDRIVAIKVLPAGVAGDPDLRARFQREAHAVAALNHPHICALYDIGCEDRIDFLVMEYLEGETLAARLTKGALPLDQVLTHSIAIADALDAAHRQHIVHRDLKPGNVMLTKAGAKLLDFGLAKLRPTETGAVAGVSAAPTMSAALTGQGTILGTLQYMAPEQVEGKEADARTDIFAFGEIVYEMATGKRAFEGKSHASLIAAILEHEPPPIAASQPLTPPGLDRIVKTSLAKDPDDRWQSARDLLRELKWIAEPGTAASTRLPATGRGRWRERVAWAIALLAVGCLIAAAAVLMTRPRPAEVAPTRFLVFPPQDGGFVPSYLHQSISPDGRHLAFLARQADGPVTLWIRSLDEVSARAIPGTEAQATSSTLFWSPDSRFIGFFAQGKLKKVAIFGGSPQTLCDAPAGALTAAGSWNRDDIIIYGPGEDGGLWRVPASGGRPTRVTTLAAQETLHVLPQFLPDGRRFLYFARPQNIVYLGELDSPTTKRLLNADSKALYATPGYLLFVSKGTLYGQAFSTERGELSGEPFVVAEQVGVNPLNGGARFSVSDTGVLTHRAGEVGFTVQMSWFDRAGKLLETVGPPFLVASFDLSSDGKRVAFSQGKVTSQTDISLFDSTRDAVVRLTFNPSRNIAPVWSPDGLRIVFSSDRDGGVLNLYQKSTSGTAQDEVLLKSAGNKQATDWSLDGRFIIFSESKPTTASDIWVLPLFGDRKPVPFLQTEFNEADGQLSPDGRWIAYTSDESGRRDVYVQPFPASGAKWLISPNGGSHPSWRRDGKELFYLDPELKLMAVDVRTSASTFDFGPPVGLFGTRVTPAATANQHLYSAATDGQRFLVANATGGQEPITVVLNWTAGLKK